MMKLIQVKLTSDGIELQRHGITFAILDAQEAADMANELRTMAVQMRSGNVADNPAGVPIEARGSGL